MCICPRVPNQFNSPERSYNNHSTHSVSGIEHVGTRNKVVSTSKNTRSAHAEISKVQRFRMMARVKEGKESARRPEDPQLSHDLLVRPRARAGAFLRLHSSPGLCLSHSSAVLPSLVGVLTFLQRIKSAGVEGAYFDGRCSPMFPV